ncbi:hypothetical protein DFH11DRAFT_796897 [Phellopilus nigrolimitatus]|nr:hypothetical protein DFH11DRAFT_796897 [Phellopilus nigrolimitatus]
MLSNLWISEKLGQLKAAVGSPASRLEAVSQSETYVYPEMIRIYATKLRSHVCTTVLVLPFAVVLLKIELPKKRSYINGVIRTPQNRVHCSAGSRIFPADLELRQSQKMLPRMIGVDKLKWCTSLLQIVRSRSILEGGERRKTVEGAREWKQRSIVNSKNVWVAQDDDCVCYFLQRRRNHYPPALTLRFSVPDH